MERPKKASFNPIPKIYSSFALQAWSSTLFGSGGKTNHVQQKILRKCVFGRALYTSLYREQKDIHTLNGHLHFIIQVHRAKGSIQRHENFHNREEGEEGIERSEEDAFMLQKAERN